MSSGYVIARFAAGRFRTTFRSLRPLLDSGVRGEKDRENLDEEFINDELGAADERKSQAELDDDARSFALGLIENWVEDPSNVRLLRIGLDLWPAKEILEKILELLGQYTSKGGGRDAPRRIAWYCLAEIFRAGATETGFVRDDESLPDAVDLREFRDALLSEAQRLLRENFGSLPWYLQQQILLFLAAYSPKAGNEFRQGRSSETKHYRELIRYLCGKFNGLTEKDFAINAILARRSFKKANEPVQLAGNELNPYRARFIAERDPSFAVEIFEKYPQKISSLNPRIRHELSLNEYSSPVSGIISLSELVISKPESGRSKLGNELTLLSFAEKFLVQWKEVKPEVVTPADVYLSVDEIKPVPLIGTVEIKQNKLKAAKGLYGVPKWCHEEMRWRIQLGYLLRFILTGQHDFSKSREPVSWKENSPIYRIPQSHWFKRIYGLHSGYTAFGADWLPISDWTEQFLYALLRWPGCRSTKFASQINGGLESTLNLIRSRIQTLQGKIGGMSETLMLPLTPNWPKRPPQKGIFTRPLRVCVVQTVVPSPDDFNTATYLTLSDPALRKRHRQHLSAAFAAIKRMLNLRESHKASDGAIDLLILPELSVHPNDVETHLVPFARANGTIILAGLTYEELFSGEPLVNSALWVIPVWSKEKGLEVLRRRQGKLNLAPNEKRKNHPVPRIQGFRPCQWLVGYPWSTQKGKEPFWLSGAVCYDATDIRLACDLRDESDLFAVCAYNKDVKTFDQMAVALQYHMFQMVVIANNGYYGGSNAYVPYSNPNERQVFHLHGQQALMAFIEIENIQEFKNRKYHSLEIPAPPDTATKIEKKWKCPPAGICLGDVCPHK
ncbi:hypothetical protein [Geobacter sp.]|uniref:hypothetical protein n=1 Tax=Geobacter sp. TaxID=46610 RepID=UPI0027B9B2A2|nr:hypothetical protein [Geobacter sp.]